ncbi:MAG: hypothetical protein RID23_08465 [Roseovarius sp.]
MTTRIKYRPDGSIDTAHYMKIGRQMRSDQAMTMLTGSTRKDDRPRRKPKGLFSFL